MRPRTAALALVLMLAACGGDDEPVADAAPTGDADLADAAVPREIVMATQPLVPGELVEGIMTGGPDDSARIYLVAPTASLDWNIHGHEDGDTQTIYEELDVMDVDYVFTPSSETDWWLLLRNGGGAAMDVEVRVELHGDMQWEWQ